MRKDNNQNDSSKSASFSFHLFTENIEIESHPSLLIYFLLLITTDNSFRDIFPNISVCS